MARPAAEAAGAALALQRAELDAIAEDQAAGLVPAGVRRALHPHELMARTNFAALEASVDDLGRRLLERIEAARAAIFAIVRAHLEAQADGPTARRRLAALRLEGIDGLPGVRDAVDAAVADAAGILTEAHNRGAARAAQEAVAQGATAVVPPSITPAPGTIARLEEAAYRAVVRPVADLIGVLAEEAYTLATGATAAEVAATLDAVNAQLSTSTVADVARTAAQGADGLGRQSLVDAAARAPGRIYASELLDRATCGPCYGVDGTEYLTLEEARGDYPNGTYVGCEGRARCRGTLVIVWQSEAEPTVR